MYTYANVIRQYQCGQSTDNTLYGLTLPSTLTLNRAFTGGGPNGTWSDEPFWEITSRPAEIPAEVLALTSPT